jgi:hypothetical protein
VWARRFFIGELKPDTLNPGDTAMNHYLLTIPSGHQHVHCYLMCRGHDPKIVEGVLNRMMDWMEERGLRPFAPCILVTTLTTSVGAVREIAGKQNKKAKRLMSQATDFHTTAWMMPDDHPDDKQLMQLH